MRTLLILRAGMVQQRRAKTFLADLSLISIVSEGKWWLEHEERKYTRVGRSWWKEVAWLTKSLEPTVQLCKWPLATGNAHGNTFFSILQHACKCCDKTHFVSNGVCKSVSTSSCCVYL
ncbi:hypothetical protein L1987_69175 [Smallanthus sonchifolius]|uniref:Uncharacterized protein n=1 Tax=Smallanthus sonchifolius TaxID=185202 RepID=A0ACB9B4R7_9ASTR|nr:hypothetical protein L1987_69175 [Smallanthus sonchifolius]